MAGRNPPSVSVTAFDAKNRLGQLLDRVAAGEEVVITRRGMPVARLVPVGGKSADEVGAVLGTFRQVREALAAAGTPVRRSEVRTWRDEGRR